MVFRFFSVEFQGEVVKSMVSRMKTSGSQSLVFPGDGIQMVLQAMAFSEYCRTEPTN